jgi:hypothetical protein
MANEDFQEELFVFLETDQEEIKSIIRILCAEEREFLNKYLCMAFDREDWEVGTLMTICYKLGRLMTNELKEQGKYTN